MAYQLLVDQQEERIRTALIKDRELVEYYEENRLCGSMVGSILLGRVERVLPDIKAAFVKIGQPLNGFLPLKEAQSYHQTCGDTSLMTGQDILVQVKKDPKGGKGAFLTRDISLPGQYILLMPCNRFIGLSKRIEDTDDRQRAQKLGEKIADGRFGIIVRHAALFASESEVLEETEELWQLWLSVSQKAPFVKPPAVLYSEPEISEILQRDYGARHSIELIREKSAVISAWNACRVDRQVREALERRVQLEDGGSLVIDEREALQTIDVNSGSHVKTAGDVSLALEENLRAVPEIARQIRLRRLSGIILVDFIDMDSEKERDLVLEAMQQAVADDRVKTVIHGFTRLGLLEMTRKRTADSLREAMTVPCAACRESGRTHNR